MSLFVGLCLLVASTAAQSTCGVSNYNGEDKIVGGAETVIEKYPWQVSIQLEGSHFCGGSIINENWILSAAHCFNDPEQPVYTDDVSIVAGSTNQASYASENVYTVNKILSHPDFVMNVKNDLSLLKLTKPINLSGNKRKAICLPSNGDVFTGQNCVATGWGTMQEGDGQPLSTNLREVELPIVDHNVCSQHDGSVDVNAICAGSVVGGKDTCLGDSGGPLICKGSNGAWKQAGIVSYGPGCAEANFYGVYTEVAKFVNWIQSTINQN